MRTHNWRRFYALAGAASASAAGSAAAVAVAAVAALAAASAAAAGAQVRVVPWLDQDEWYVTEGDGPHDVKFSIVNENDYAVVVDWEQASTGPTQGNDITDSILVDGIPQSAFGVTIRPHWFTTATVEFSPFSFPDAGPPNDGWVDLRYDIHTRDGWGAGDFVIVNVSDTPEPGTLVLFGSGLLGLSGWLGKRLQRV